MPLVVLPLLLLLLLVLLLHLGVKPSRTNMA